MVVVIVIIVVIVVVISIVVVLNSFDYSNSGSDLGSCTPSTFWSSLTMCGNN